LRLIFLHRKGEEEEEEASKDGIKGEKTNASGLPYAPQEDSVVISPKPRQRSFSGREAEVGRSLQKVGIVFRAQQEEEVKRSSGEKEHERYHLPKKKRGGEEKTSEKIRAEVIVGQKGERRKGRLYAHGKKKQKKEGRRFNSGEEKQGGCNRRKGWKSSKRGEKTGARAEKAPGLFKRKGERGECSFKRKKTGAFIARPTGRGKMNV